MPDTRAARYRLAGPATHLRACSVTDYRRVRAWSSRPSRPFQFLKSKSPARTRKCFWGCFCKPIVCKTCSLSRGTRGRRSRRRARMGRGHDRAHGLQACRAGPSRRRRLPSAPGCEPAHAPACLQPPRRTLAWGCGCVGAWAADAWAAAPTHTTNVLPFDEAAVADEALPGLRVVRCQAHSIRYCASTCAASAASRWTTGAVKLWSCGAAVAVVSSCGCVHWCRTCITCSLLQPNGPG